MDFFRRSNVWTYIVFYSILAFLVRPNESVELGDLKVACGVKYIPGDKGMCLSDVPSACTSIILNYNDFSDKDDLCAMMANPPTKPLYLVEDSVKFSEWVSKFNLNSGDVKNYTDKIDQFNLAGIIFDNMYSSEITSGTNDVITTGLPVFLTTIRKYYTALNKNIVLGVVIPNNPDVIQNGFSYSTLDSAVDVYLVNSTNYFPSCTPFGGSLSPAFKIKATADALTDPLSTNLFSLTKTKIVMTIQLYAKDALQNQELSYQETCALCPGTKVCRDSIKTTYLKAQIINNYTFAGAYVRYCNTDDKEGWCYCGEQTPFPGLAAVDAGINSKTLEFIQCPSYGVPGVYRTAENTCDNSSDGSTTNQDESETSDGTTSDPAENESSDATTSDPTENESSDATTPDPSTTTTS